MHPQIKTVINSLMSQGPGRISIRLSAPQYTPLGQLLGILYYRIPDLVDMLPVTDRFGYPHNGGSHTFEYHGPAKEFVAWLELWKEQMETMRLLPEEQEVRSQLSFISQEILSLKRKV